VYKLKLGKFKCLSSADSFKPVFYLGASDTSVILAIWEDNSSSLPREIVNKTPSPKQPEQKGLEVAQPVDHLLCKSEVLSSNSCATKKFRK
jgi:hypothetical protein